MRKLCLFLIFISFSYKAYASHEPRTGIVRQLIKEERKIKKIGEGLASRFNSRLITDINLNDEYQSTDSRDQFRNNTITSRLSTSFDISQNLAINGFFKIEQFDKSSETTRRNTLSSGGGDRSFEDEGLFIEELNISYEDDAYAFIFGKFNPNFGSAWRWDRGIWNHEIAKNYRQVEKLGFQGVHLIGDAQKTGHYKFGYSIFTNDRKNFDNSKITKRDSDLKSDAIPGDTRSLKSYVLSLDVDFDFSKREKLSYHFSFADLAINSQAAADIYDESDNQKAFSAGMHYKYPLLSNFDIDTLLEYAKVKNYLGNADVKEQYFTSNLIAKIYQNYNITLGYAKRQNIVAQSFGYDQNVTELSCGYEFTQGKLFDHLLLQFGYKNQRDDYKESLESKNSLGFLLRYQKDF